MRKIMTVVGTRPELIKMCCVIQLFDKHTKHLLVHTGQNYDYELNQIFFDELNIRKPDYFLDAAASTPAATIARVIERVDDILARERPDAVLLYGDTNSCLSVIAAKRRGIPVFHMEAGNRCFDSRVPEELNRKLVDHLSDINITITEHARRYLLAENFAADRIFTVGSHLPEVINRFQGGISASTILNRLGITCGRYFLVSAHREENVDHPDRLKRLFDALGTLADTYGQPVLVSTHPRTRTRLKENACVGLHPYIRFEKPFGFFDYIHLQQHAHCVLSDSGTITEESAILNFPAVTIRDSHERPEGMDDGVLIMCGLSTDSILNAVRLAVAERSIQTERAEVFAYSRGHVSWPVLKIVHSYIDYVKPRGA